MEAISDNINNVNAYSHKDNNIILFVIIVIVLLLVIDKVKNL